MHVLIVGPYGSGFLYFEEAKKRGMTTSAVTLESSDYAIPGQVRKNIDNLIIIKDREIDTVVGAASRLNKDHPVDGILAGEEFFVEQTAHAAYVLGLPSIAIGDASAVRNKAIMRERLHRANVRIPKFAKARNALDLEDVTRDVGFPAVIKPLRMVGSIGVARVNNQIELLAAYEDIVNNDETSYGFTLGTEVLIEELLVGTEFCINGYVTIDGTINVVEFVQYELGPQPYFQVVGYTAYHPEDLADSDAMAAYVTSVVRALNITVGAFHAEIMLTDDGPVLIEIANRLPGDHIPLFAERVSGISSAGCALAAAMGISIPKPKPALARVAANQYITAPDLMGKAYKNLIGWDEITRHPAVDMVTIDVQSGEKISSHNDERSRLAKIEYHANSVGEAAAFRKKILETVRVSQ